MKSLGKIIGVDNVDKFTNHALRGYAITKMHAARVPLAMRMKFARHSCEQSQIPYARLTNDGFIEAQLALRGVNGTTDKVIAATNEVMKESNKRKFEECNKENFPVLSSVIPVAASIPKEPVHDVLPKKRSWLEELSKEEFVAMIKRVASEDESTGSKEDSKVTSISKEVVKKPQGNESHQNGNHVPQYPFPPPYWNPYAMYPPFGHPHMYGHPPPGYGHGPGFGQTSNENHPLPPYGYYGMPPPWSEPKKDS